MIKIRIRFEDWQDKIKEYCESNMLSFEKARRAVRASNDYMLVLQWYAGSSQVVNIIGLKDETPMPVVLIMRKSDDGISFEQTKDTIKYLS